MTKEFKKGDKVYWINHSDSVRQEREVKEVFCRDVFFTNGAFMPIDEVFHLEEDNNESNKRKTDIIHEEGDECPSCHAGYFKYDTSNCQCSGPITQFSTLGPCSYCESNDYELYCENCGLYESEAVEAYFEAKNMKDNPFKNIKTPIYTLDTISEACFDYMFSHGVIPAKGSSTRKNIDKKTVYYPKWHSVDCSPVDYITEDDGRIKLSKEEFYKAIGFVESNKEIKEKTNMPLFGNELINKYRK